VKCSEFAPVLAFARKHGGVFESVTAENSVVVDYKDNARKIALYTLIW